jgi:hypothetical protein
MLFCDVRRGSRKAQVLGSPRMPNAKGNHLLLKQGEEITPTGLAPPRRDCAGWVRAPPILRPNYEFTLSSGYVTCLMSSTTAQCQKLRGFNPCRVSQGRVDD